jgi:voltage-gated potassium channel
VTSDLARRAELLAKLERWTDRPLTVLAFLLIPLILAPYLLDLSPEVQTALLGIDYLIWGAFAADLIAKLVIAPDRLAYLRRHWLDVFLVVVPILRPLRAARAIRLVWAAGAATRVLDGTGRLMARRGTGYVLLAAVLVVFVAAALVVVVERDSPNATIRSYGDAIWWALSTVTTVGYGDSYPVTATGRGVAVALMLLGIAAFGLITANLAAFFVEEQDDEVKARLRGIDDRLRRIEAALEQRDQETREDHPTSESRDSPAGVSKMTPIL